MDLLVLAVDIFGGGCHQFGGAVTKRARRLFPFPSLSFFIIIVIIGIIIITE